jgi:hypothetical protein
MLKRTTILMGVVSALLLSACGEKIPEPTAEVCLHGNPFYSFRFAAQQGLSKAGIEEFVFQCRVFAAKHPELSTYEHNLKPGKPMTTFREHYMEEDAKKKDAKKKGK